MSRRRSNQPELPGPLCPAQGSNLWPPRCEHGALPAELAWRDLFAGMRCALCGIRNALTNKIVPATWVRTKVPRASTECPYQLDHPGLLLNCSSPPFGFAVGRANSSAVSLNAFRLACRLRCAPARLCQTTQPLMINSSVTHDTHLSPTGWRVSRNESSGQLRGGHLL